MNLIWSQQAPPTTHPPTHTHTHTHPTHARTRTHAHTHTLNRHEGNGSPSVSVYESHGPHSHQLYVVSLPQGGACTYSICPADLGKYSKLLTQNLYGSDIMDFIIQINNWKPTIKAQYLLSCYLMQKHPICKDIISYVVFCFPCKYI